MHGEKGGRPQVLATQSVPRPFPTAHALRKILQINFFIFWIYLRFKCCIS